MDIPKECSITRTAMRVSLWRMDESTFLVVTICKVTTVYTRSTFSILKRKHGFNVANLAPDRIGPQIHLACSYSRAIRMRSFIPAAIQEISRAHNLQNHRTRSMRAGIHQLSLFPMAWCWSPAVLTRTIQCLPIQTVLPKERRTFRKRIPPSRQVA